MKKSAFTLVETLIVIIVFGIGILSVLYGIVQTLGNQDKAQIQITSSFLAREGIELMYNLRDSNQRKSLPRNCVFQPSEVTSISLDDEQNPFCDGLFEPGIVLKISMNPAEYTIVEKSALTEDFDQNFETHQLYYMTGNESFQYTYGPEGEPLRYARYLLIQEVLDGAGETLPPDYILKIESHVLYKKGHLTGEKVMESFIGNYVI